ncbi:MAG: TVP38/TMEM64 family protein [Rhodospirillaceae bacterium]
MADHDLSNGRQPAPAGWRRFAPLAVLLLGLLAFFAFDLGRYASFESLQKHRDLLVNWVNQAPVISALTITLIYVAVVAFSLPIASLVTLLCGFLLGQIWGTIVVVVGATTGAIIIFLATRSAFGAVLRRRAGPFVGKLQAGFNANAMSYLLILRLIPIVPFWLVNIVPAMLGVRLHTFAWTTFVGIIPGSFVFVGLGNGLGQILAQGQLPGIGFLLQWQIIGPLLLLAVLSAAPIAYKRWRGAPPSSDDDVALG